MPSPLVIHPEQTLAVAPRYFGSVDYYATIAAYGRVIVDGSMRADKRYKDAHRCRIVDTRDEILLTVPVSHPHGPHSWAETTVSTHGQWWAKQLTALESAYGRTPFFEFYIDRFASIFDGRQYADGAVDVMTLDARGDTIVREILGLDNEVVYNRCETACAIDADMRDRKDFACVEKPYYQVRADKLGFRPHLSVLDLIFNVGPEAPLVLLSK